MNIILINNDTIIKCIKDQLLQVLQGRRHSVHQL